MADATPDVQALLVTRVVIERYIHADGEDDVITEAVSTDGRAPSVVTVLGMLEMAKIAAMSCDCDEDE